MRNIAADAERKLFLSPSPSLIQDPKSVNSHRICHLPATALVRKRSQLAHGRAGSGQAVVVQNSSPAEMARRMAKMIRCRVFTSTEEIEQSPPRAGTAPPQNAPDEVLYCEKQVKAGYYRQAFGWMNWRRNYWSGDDVIVCLQKSC